MPICINKIIIVNNNLMKSEDYKKLLKRHRPKETKLNNAFIAFLVGGSLGFFCELVSYLLVANFNISVELSYSIICLVMIITSCLFTAMGFFDDLIIKGKCGLIIPTTGFAHSVTSSALEFRKDGMITGLGSNFFKLAGSVILYGIVSAFFLCLIKGVYLWLV